MAIDFASRLRKKGFAPPAPSLLFLPEGENAQILKSRLPQAELFMIPNAGHNFFAEDPMGIHQRIVEFLKG